MNYDFIDSSFLIALAIRTDNNNKRAKELKDILTEKRVINEVVMIETLNIFSKRCNANSKDMYNILERTHEIVFLNKNDYLESVELCSFYNNAINYSDCIILKTMQDLNINKIVSFDEGFDKIKGIERIY